MATAELGPSGQFARYPHSWGKKMLLNGIEILTCTCEMAYAKGVSYDSSEKKKLLHTSQSVKDRPEAETAFVDGEVLTKAIQACLTTLHSYSRNAVWKK